jgi:hypothetical protein
MKKIVLLFVTFLSIFRFTAIADEGMWIPMFIDRLNYTDMQKMGLKLTAEEIYSVNKGSIKDAIVIFGRGCTGEVISDQSLILTNHHCGYGSIQSVSSVENDFLTNGFWAKSISEEIPVPGLTVQFLIRMSDVTTDMLAGTTENTTEAERIEILKKNRKAIETQATTDNHYNAVVKDYFEGNEFYLLVYETFKDIRLVGAPPEVIGKFGADTDNWMWPRHTGDFSMFRVYAGADNKPAEYSAENKPFKPRHFLPVSIAGIQKDDFSMIMGYPGTTDRYLTSWGVNMAVEETGPTIVKIREEKLRIMKEGMNADEKVRLQYSSKYAGTANYWKFFIGQTKGLKQLKVADQKKRVEADFNAWMDASPEETKQYGNALPLISGAYSTIRLYNVSRLYYAEGIMRGSEILSYANRFDKLKQLLADKTAKPEAIEAEIKQLKSGAAGQFKDYNLQVDQNLLSEMLAMFSENVKPEHQPELLKEMAVRYKGNFAAMAADIFGKSNFVSVEKVTALLEDPKVKTIDKDPAYKLMQAFMKQFTVIQKQSEAANLDLQKGNRLFLAALREMQPGRKFYPNANSTMRMTYGTVLDYYPADAVHYDFTTNLDGVMEKEDPSVREFTVPDKMKEIYKNKDFGRYGNEDGTMTVNFLTTHDITGGNSGSPVIDGQGRLIGLAFDGNWEAMSGNIAFEPKLQRTINVDIRYVMLIIDKYAGAQNLIDEMVIVNDRPLK